jgi:hypothetical protein
MIGGDLRKRWKATVRRVAWGRRLEIGLTLIAWMARLVLSHVLGHVLSFVVLAAGAGAFVCMPQSREWLLDQTRGEMIERWFSRAVAHIGIRAFDGGIQIAESRTVPGGVNLAVMVPEGTTVGVLVNGSEKLAVALGAREIRVHGDPARAGRADVTVLYDDPLGEAEVRWPWADAWQTLLWQGLPFGIDEQGHNVQLDLVGHNLLVGGLPGSGKSNALSLVVSAAALDPNVQLWFFGGEHADLACWRYSAMRYVGSDIAEATRVLIDLRGLVNARQEMLNFQRLHKITPDMHVDLVLVVVEELAFYVKGDGQEQTALVECLVDIATRGRTAGVVVVAATRTIDAVPTVLGEHFDYRLALRCATRETSDNLLRSGWPPVASSAADIDVATPGTSLLLAEDLEPKRIRCYRLDEEDIDAAAGRAAQLRNREGE